MNISGLSGQIESLVQQYRTSQRRFVAPLETTRTRLDARLKALSDLRTKLESLNKIVTDLRKNDSNLSVYSARSSDESILTATASSGKSVGTHSITVSQLAKQDTVISAQMASGGNDLSTSLGPGSHSFTITVDGVETEISIIVEDDDTNATIMQKVAAAVSSGVDGVRGSVVANTSSTSRLVLKSDMTGSQHQLILQDGNSGLLHSLGLTANVLTNRTASTSTDAGYLHSSPATLDAKFVLDGIEIIRGTNVVDDVLSGVTLSLSNTSERPVLLTVAPDTPAIKDRVEKFISTYNDVMQYLTSRTEVDPALNVRQIFAGDSQVRGLRLDLRMIVGGPVPGIDAGHLNSLFAMGIQVRSDGTLHIADTTKFEDALANELESVVSIFNSEHGIAVRFYERLQSFISRGGIIDNSRQSVDGQLKSIRERIKEAERRIDARVDRFRNEFLRMQNMVAIANQQLQMIYNLRLF